MLFASTLPLALDGFRGICIKMPQSAALRRIRRALAPLRALCGQSVGLQALHRGRARRQGGSTDPHRGAQQRKGPPGGNQVVCSSRNTLLLSRKFYLRTLAAEATGPRQQPGPSRLGRGSGSARPESSCPMSRPGYSLTDSSLDRVRWFCYQWSS